MFNKQKSNANQNNIQDFIKVYDNIIEDDLCDLVISEYGESDEWQEEGIDKKGEVDRSIRYVEGLHISLEDTIKKNPETRSRIDAELFNRVGKAIELYNIDFPHCNVVEDTGYTLLRYNKGQYYKEHTDSFKHSPRMVTAILALNDDYEGGEFGFFQKSVTYKLNKGSVLLFPSNFMYPHEVLKVTKGTRFSIVTWFV